MEFDMKFIAKAFGSILAIAGVVSVSTVLLGVTAASEDFLPYIGFGIILGLFAFSTGISLMVWTERQID
jgi:hypothetical protein